MSFNKEALNTLYKLKKEIQKSSNHTLVSQIDHAIMKTYHDELVISFIGHYSAGKSSLINHLLSTEILPASPVPTTSNTVQVQISNDNNIQAFLDQYQYVQLSSYEELKKINTKDIDIAAINMDIQHDAFQSNTVFQDTPGVDSKTGTHQETTNRFLLNSDYIFFTVEYNHVQSEQNLKLLQSISDLNIPVSLIINQVDKHDSQELTFDTFLSRIRQTLKDWNINLENIFTTSIYDSPYNQVHELNSSIHSLEARKESIQNDFFERITENIEAKQLEYLQSQIDEVANTLGVSESLTALEAESKIRFLDEEIKKYDITALHKDTEALKSHVSESVKKIVKDSYIFPHSVKTAVTEFLKIKAGEVKIPGFFNKQKKKDELLNTALKEVEENFTKVIDTEINAPVNSFFGNIGLTGKSFKYEWSNSMLEEPHITSLSNQFILNYLDKIKASLSKNISKTAVELLNDLQYTRGDSDKDREKLVAERENYQYALEILMLIESIESTNYRHFYIHMDDELEKLDLTEEVVLDLQDTSQDERADAESFSLQYEERIDLQPVFDAQAAIKGVPRYKDFEVIIEDRLKRLDEGKANISVFGGFSAGKTTFINALMGEDTLTTSPNPTTATITEINNADSSTVVYKNKSDLIETLKTISNLNYSEVGEYTKWITKNIDKVSETYKPFLHGILNHFSDYEHVLGETLEIKTEELIQKISTDEEATFIHKANVALNNDLTSHYNLIDSPGINSTNQRHTKETRNIIADSDLIIYVSYYNHVFSQSDESFLKYIRSIKGENFPIIFIINAVDLMKNEKDKQKVLNYMTDSLISMEINHVIYPVSSKQALNNNDTAFNTAKEEIIKIADDHAKVFQYHDLMETVYQLLSRIKSNIRQFENKESEQSRLLSQRSSLKSSLNQLSAFNVKPRLTQEIDVVLTFIKKRFELKLYDYLKTLITNDDAKVKDYLVKNETLISQNIEEFLTLEIATVFNSIYRLADESLAQLISEFNEELKYANTIHTLSLSKNDGEEPLITIDPTHFKEFSKSLYQARNDIRQFRDVLLNFSSHLIASIDMEVLREKMDQLIDHYLSSIDTHLQPEISNLLKELDEPIPEIKQSDYEEDIKILDSLSHMKE